jgi:hypothetical protein
VVSGEWGVVYCLLPIAYCPLPIAHCPLPIAYCLLPIAHCPCIHFQFFFDYELFKSGQITYFRHYPEIVFAANIDPNRHKD